MGLDITLLGHYPPPHGGVAALMRQMRAALEAAGCTVTVLNLGPGRPTGPGIVQIGQRNRLRQVIETWRALRRSRSAVFHYISASYRSFWLGVVCLALARLAGRRMVVSFVGGAFGSFIGGLGWPARGVARVALGQAAALIACNPAIATTLAQLAPGRRIEMLTNCFVSAGATIRGDPAVLPDALARFVELHRPVIACTGAASPEYGLGNAVMALPRLREARPDAGLVLVVTRYGQVDGRGELEAAIAAQGVAEHVLITSDIPDFTALLARSDLFLRTARVDGDSMSVREALALGVPTVASDAAPRPDGVVTYGRDDVEGLVEALHEALTAPRGDPIAVASESAANVEALLGIYRRIAEEASG
ncbi:MAG: glycosyltransferase family 4 protein [Candidatus Eiseniibacteriota bacterium]|jgi:glycosyltransferase involved in cell wall biosynthesis